MTLFHLGVPVAGLALLPTGRAALVGLGLGVAAAFGSLIVIGDDGTGFGTLVQLPRHRRRAAPMNTMLALVAILVVLAGLALTLLAGP